MPKCHTGKKKITVTNILLSITGEKPQPTICERQNQRSDQMSNGPNISFEDTAVLAHTRVDLSNLTHKTVKALLGKDIHPVVMERIGAIH